MCGNQLLTSQGHKNAHSSIEGYIGGRRTGSVPSSRWPFELYVLEGSTSCFMSRAAVGGR
jgi:hypothetical protein